MKEIGFLVLKGRNILAQGKRPDSYRESVALGWKTGIKIVRAITSIKEKILFRTKQITSRFLEMMTCNSVRNNDIALISIFVRTAFLLHPLPRAAFRIVPPETMPWARLYWPFRPEKDSDLNLYQE